MNSTQLNSIRYCKNCSGGGLGVLFIGMLAIILIFTVFLNIADYSIFAYNKDAISKSVDYAVCAAVQELDISQSLDGLSQGYSDEGATSIKGIRIDTAKAMAVFLDTLKSNSRFLNINFKSSIIGCTTYANESGMNYEICTYNDMGISIIAKGKVDRPSQLEEIINNTAQNLRSEAEAQSGMVYVNGNPNTNFFENGSYFLVYVKGVRVTGLNSERSLDFTGFAGSRVYR